MGITQQLQVSWKSRRISVKISVKRTIRFIEVTSAMRLFIVILKHREIPDFLGLFSSLFLLNANVLFRMLLWPLEAHLKL